MTAKLYDYDVINADNQIIDTISAKNQLFAAHKLRAMYKPLDYCLRLKKTGNVRHIEITNNTVKEVR